MEDSNRHDLIDEASKGPDHAVIDDLENEKMEVLNSNASTATLNMQNFGNVEYQHTHEAITDSTAVDGAFDSKLSFCFLLNCLHFSIECRD